MHSFGLTNLVIGMICGLLAGTLIFWQANLWQIALASLMLMLLSYWQSKRIKVSLFPEIKTRVNGTAPFPTQVQTLVDELNKPDTTPPRRLKIGNQLAALGDPRRGVGLNDKGLPDIDWLKIPTGKFLFGEDNRKLIIDTFNISRYPITNLQYQAFIDDDGYQNLDYWTQIKKPASKSSRWTQINRPREIVNWFEAIAFCRWLSQRINIDVNLPTEQQWEKAARGTKALIYPWGNRYKFGYANLHETRKKTGNWHLKQTSAVGHFPKGSSPESVMDMSGNVWEWCLNTYDNTNDISISDRSEPRVLRGGSWGSGPNVAHSTDRYRLYPGGRYDNVGFRVVCSHPSIDTLITASLNTSSP